MKLLSWNVNGLRACEGKGFYESMAKADADVVCLQEIKLQAGQYDRGMEGYHAFWNYAEKKGYSGTAVFTREEPIKVDYGIGIPEHDREGRVIRAEFERFTLVNCYTPNAQRGLERLGYRMEWEDAFRALLARMDAEKPVILCGDLNVAHQPIDLKHPTANRGNAGFTDEEREKFTALLEAGFTDSFRYLYPDKKDAYSWWSYMHHARANNSGWRIDYFVVSDRLKGSIADAEIHADIFGSDHCPVSLTLA